MGRQPSRRQLKRHGAIMQLLNDQHGVPVGNIDSTPTSSLDQSSRQAGPGEVLEPRGNYW